MRLQVVVTDRVNEQCVLPLTVMVRSPEAATSGVLRTLAPVAVTNTVPDLATATERDAQPNDVDVATVLPAAAVNDRVGCLRFSEAENVTVVAVDRPVECRERHPIG